MKKSILILLAVLISFNLFAWNALEGTKNVLPEKPYKVAALLKTLQNPFWVAMRDGLQEEAERLGIQLDVYAAQTENDMSGQLAIMESIVQKDYDAILFAPITPTNLIPAIVEANKKGIVVANLDAAADFEKLNQAGGHVVGFVSTNNYNVGKMAAQYIANLIGEGEVAVIEGIAGEVSSENRKNGFLDEIKKYENIKVVSVQPANWDRMRALDVATNMLTSFPNIKAIYACNDTMALGAAQAVFNMGKSGKAHVVGTDGIPEALQAVQSGRMSATIAQDPAGIGIATLRVAIFTLNAMNGEVPAQLITK
jgi:D-allose transport system substrate-binding protein